MKKVIKNLSKESSAYYQDNDYYELFSKAEDKTEQVTEYLKQEVREKVVLDAGCGTGKYLERLEPFVKKYIGIDLSFQQLEKASAKISREETTLIQGNLKKLPLKDNSMDIVISTWVLGTITNIEERKSCLKELQRVVVPTGKIILIENAEGSEFESIRGRTKNKKTKEYNDWLIAHGFYKIKTIETYFLFSTLKEAKKCFEVIYGKEKAKKVTSCRVQHTIVCFEYRK